MSKPSTPKINSNIPKVAELRRKGGICPICGYDYKDPTWYGRNYAPTKSSAHRYFQRQHAPGPEPLIAGFPEGDISAHSRSPAWMHKLVYERARYLQRQERYDFVPWDETHGIRDDEFEKDVHALLLIEPPHIPVGVISFSWKKMVKPAARLASEFHMDRRHMAQKRRCFAALAIMVANLRRFYH